MSELRCRPSSANCLLFFNFTPLFFSTFPSSYLMTNSLPSSFFLSTSTFLPSNPVYLCLAPLIGLPYCTLSSSRHAGQLPIVFISTRCRHSIHIAMPPAQNPCSPSQWGNTARAQGLNPSSVTPFNRTYRSASAFRFNEFLCLKVIRPPNRFRDSM